MVSHFSRYTHARRGGEHEEEDDDDEDEEEEEQKSSPLSKASRRSSRYRSIHPRSFSSSSGSTENNGISLVVAGDSRSTERLKLGAATVSPGGLKRRAGALFDRVDCNNNGIFLFILQIGMRCVVILVSWGGVVERQELMRVHGSGDVGALLSTMDANEVISAPTTATTLI